jgi:hypothetical protein
MESLLGSFYSRIRGSQEDIASEGLVYILQRSSAASGAVRRMVSQECGVELPPLSFKAQATGENLERPDISGVDESFTERLIIEAKFWAALTANQPVEYLRRLPAPHGVLLFICPSLRVRLLWDELLRRVQQEGLPIRFDADRHLVSFGNGRFLFIKTWDQVLGLVKDAVMQEGNRALISDTDQIIGFCHKMDDIAFLPILEEDLAPSVGKRIYSYYLLVDKLLHELKKRVDLDLSGMKATPQKDGYTRYFKAYDFGLRLDLNFKYWYEHAETPFYLGIYSSKTKWIVTPELIQACKKAEALQNFKLVFIEGRLLFPIFPAFNEPEEVVLEKMSYHVAAIISRVYEYMAQEPG